MPEEAQPDASPNPVTREPWETPRVLASEPFDSTEVGMDGDPMEGASFYGPNS
jgi:hypothetical protein